MNLDDDRVRVLFNAKRFMIATILYVRGEMTMAELQRHTGLSWGDLDSNLRVLIRHGIVESRKIVTRRGPRTMVGLTRSGEALYEELTRILTDLIGEARRSRG